MLRKKEPKVIVTFHTTAGAIETERICRDREVPGRIIPVPRELSAGCGLAWCSPEAEKECLCRLLEQEQIETEDIVEMMF